MPLVNVDLSCDHSSVSTDVIAFVREADRRIARFQRDSRIPGFVASDFVLVYRALQAIAAANLEPGRLFCEWGSGFGVVACLAAMLDFEASGIEIDGELVDRAQQLATDFELPAEFVRGSFIPRGAEKLITSNGEFSWLTVEPDDSHEGLGLEPDDFDLIFAYPWPDEEGVIEKVFERYAARGALLLTYHGGDTLRLLRKTKR